MISVKNLNYEYADKKALDNVTFEIVEGSITALVGPNGAGKTTLLRSLAALTKPLSGQVITNGFDTVLNPQEVHLQVGYLQDLFGLYNQLTVLQSLQFTTYSRLTDVNSVNAAIALAIERTGIEGFVNKKISSLSRGMLQKVGIAQAIVHQPKILLLDEPASGLDPEARHLLSNLLLKLRSYGMTILVSSHILAELEDYSTDMLVIQDGKMIEHRKLNLSTLTNSIVNLEVKINDYSAEYYSDFQNIEGVTVIEIKGNNVNLKVDELLISKQNLLKLLINKNIPIEEFSIMHTNLQDEYIKTLSQYKNSTK